ncbi:DNA repair protein RecO [Verrucomicrobia bacterium LW23]|nr:DNA repair protein RecO [Verrucomicrobia bacterium LW23]
MKGESVSTEALLLSTLHYGDTSLIVRWLSPGGGRFSTIARGAHNPHSPFAGSLDLFFLCDVQYIAARGSTSPSGGSPLHLLKEVHVLEPHVELRRDYSVLMTAHYFTALVEAMTEPESPLEEDYALLLKALQYLTTHPASLRLVERFELRLLTLHGMAPAPGQSPDDVLLSSHVDVPQGRVELMPLLRQAAEERERARKEAPPPAEG